MESTTTAPCRGLRWWRSAGVRARSAVAVTVLQTAVVTAAGAVLLLALHDNLDSSIDTGDLATAQGVSALVDADIAASTGAVATRNAPDRKDLQDAIDAAAQRRAVVQVLNADGAVIASTGELRGSGAVLDRSPATGERLIDQRPFPSGDDAYRFTALGAQVDGERFTVVIGQSLGTGESTVRAAEVALAVAGRLLLVAVGGATHLFVGRSLRPVRRIRSTVEGISHRDLSERVPVPPRPGRGLAAGPDDEPHVRRPRPRLGSAAAVRLRRQPRTPQPGRDAAGRRRHRPDGSRRCEPRGPGRAGARRDPAPGPPGGGPAAAGPHRRTQPWTARRFHRPGRRWAVRVR